MTDPAMEPENRPSRRLRNWRDAGLLAIIGLAFASPWILSEFTATTPSVAPSPPILAALSAFVPQLPRDEIERQAVAVAQQGLRELLQARDSSAPPPVFDPGKIRVDHPQTDVWNVSVAQIAPVLPYLLLVLILIFRPMGLLGTRDT